MFHVKHDASFLVMGARRSVGRTTEGDGMKEGQTGRLLALVDGDWPQLLGEIGPDESDIFGDPEGSQTALTTARFGTVVIVAIADGDGDSRVSGHDHGSEDAARRCYRQFTDQGRAAQAATVALRDLVNAMQGIVPKMDIPDASDPRWHDPGPREV